MLITTAPPLSSLPKTQARKYSGALPATAPKKELCSFSTNFIITGDYCDSTVPIRFSVTHTTRFDLCCSQIMQTTGIHSHKYNMSKEEGKSSKPKSKPKIKSALYFSPNKRFIFHKVGKKKSQPVLTSLKIVISCSWVQIFIYTTATFRHNRWETELKEKLIPRMLSTNNQEKKKGRKNERNK